MKELLTNKKFLIGAGILVLCLGGLNFWLFSDRENITPETYIEAALFCLGPADEYPIESAEHLSDLTQEQLRSKARSLTEKAEALAFPGQEFTVPFSYIYGTILFEEASAINDDPDARFKKFQEAEEELALANRVMTDKIENDYTRKMHYALGVTLHEIGDYDNAVKELVETFKIKEDYFVDSTWQPIALTNWEESDASLRLQEIWLHSKNQKQLMLAGDKSNELSLSLNPLPEDATKQEQKEKYEAEVLNTLSPVIKHLYPEKFKQNLKRKIQIRHKQDLEQKYQALLLRAQIFAAINDSEELKELAQFKDITVEQIFQHFIFKEELAGDKTRMDADSTQIILARQHMVAQNYRAAIKILKQIAEKKGLDRTYARKAQFLHGRCLQALGDRYKRTGNDREANKNYNQAFYVFDRTADEYEDTDEGLAASLMAAYIYQKVDQHEYAMNRYRKTLSLIPSREDYRNQWFSLEEFEDIIEEGWKSWVESHHYEEAIRLAKLLKGLFDENQSRTLIAETYKQHAEHLEEELKKAPYTEWDDLTRELRAKWVEAGKASKLKAATLKSAEKYSETLWESAEQFRKGHDFDNSIDVLQDYLSSAPTIGQARAYVRLGENYMDVDKYDDAERTFNYVLLTFPTDAYAYEAQFLIGKCYFEKSYLSDEENDYLLMAEKAFLKVITSTQLTPDALEWRKTLFALGELYYLHGSMIQNESAHDIVLETNTTADDDLSEPLENKDLNQAFGLWDKAITRLGELLERFPNDTNKVNARYWLAHAYRRSAEKPQAELPSAETDTARNELRKQKDSFLRSSLEEFKILKFDLIKLRNVNRLDLLGQRILKNCFLEIAHLEYGLQQYSDAVLSYNSFLSEYPDDQFSLIASIQLANCYRELGQDQPARASIESAKYKFSQLRAAQDDVFGNGEYNLTKDDWKHWLIWALENYGSPTDDFIENL